ncbi:blue copper domain-containing protein [Candidatus Nitrososphaera gargensis Ga9.2]|uniref:Blue copper domain-containing protein n=1 Tax=Nitrososphaera gargensis (strain Ga9.2) TaxID=1237085 RepID=K0IIC2_NITGG|nr:plastocyanin/azurin family copper-binding protein [Candidatus Nitrososphaera gargensis]AFU57772.1 blue copper domain-containing protein [Candidatus Nitrososphaera gargensis Ga9.2]
MSLIPSLGLSKTQVSGAVVAAIVAASIAIAAMGILAYIRKMEPLKTWLVVYEPASQYGGIFFYSNVIWGSLWVGLFFALRHRQSMSNLRTWLIFFLVSLGIGTGFAKASLDWSQLPTVMQLGSNGEEAAFSTGGQQIANEISIKILEGSSIQGNPAYEPTIVTASRDSVIIWVNEDAAPHTVTSGIGISDPETGNMFDSGSIGKGQKFSLPVSRLEETGTFDYYCTVHPFMKGKIIIE